MEEAARPVRLWPSSFKSVKALSAKASNAKVDNVKALAQPDCHSFERAGAATGFTPLPRRYPATVNLAVSMAASLKKDAG